MANFGSKSWKATDRQPYVGADDGAEEKVGDYWYRHRHELEPGMVFRTSTGEIVQLDRTVPGDGTKWYVLDWHNGWAAYDSTIEPGDLVGDPQPEPKKDAT